MMTTANYIIKAVIDGEAYLFEYNTSDVWTALEEFWHEDYCQADFKSTTFPIDVYCGIPRVIKTCHFTFNAAIFHAFYDNGHKAKGVYTLDEFERDIRRADAANEELRVKNEELFDAKKLRKIMDRWADFSYNHPPYDKVILWMVGGSKEHYLYQHFCRKWLHLCENVCQNDTMATWIKFYRTLDDEWAERLMEYVFLNDNNN